MSSCDLDARQVAKASFQLIGDIALDLIAKERREDAIRGNGENDLKFVRLFRFGIEIGARERRHQRNRKKRNYLSTTRKQVIRRRTLFARRAQDINQTGHTHRNCSRSSKKRGYVL